MWAGDSSTSLLWTLTTTSDEVGSTQTNKARESENYRKELSSIPLKIWGDIGQIVFDTDSMGTCVYFRPGVNTTLQKNMNNLY